MIAELDVRALTDWLDSASKRYVAEQAYLCELDAAIGDGDHGANMARGFSAGVAKLGAPASPAALFKAMGMTLIGTVGGASGPLYGTFFIEMGKAAGNQVALDVASWAQILATGLAGVVARGKAQPGEKTMIDALEPAVRALREASDLATALAASAAAAKQGAVATTELIARKGRASYLGERAIGHQDPGATSLAMLLEELAVIGA